MINTINQLLTSVVDFLKLPISLGEFDLSLWDIVLVVLGVDLLVIVIAKILDL